MRDEQKASMENKVREVWADITDASREHMQLSFQQNRMRILAECQQMKTDVDSYNENYNPGEKLEFSYNFEVDIEAGAS